MVIRKSNKRVRNNHAKKTRPVVRYNNNNNRQNHAETQDGGMILGFDGPVTEISQHNIREIINRLFVGICGVASTKGDDFLAGIGGIMYADIGGTLTKISGKTNEYMLETPVGIERDGRRSDKPVYSNPATNTFLLTPSEAELTEYKKQAATVNKQIWDGSIIDMIYDGKMGEVNGLLDSVGDRKIKFSIATSTTLSIGKIKDFLAARHTLLYVASRSPAADTAMVEALIRHGCIVNQPNPPRVGKKNNGVRSHDWTSGANVTPIWGAVKTMCGVVEVSQDIITRKKELVITLIRYDANVQAIHPTGDRIRAFIVENKPNIFVNDRHFETYFTSRAPLLDTHSGASGWTEHNGWTAENVVKLQNVTKYTRKGVTGNADYVTHQYPISKYDDLPKIESVAAEYNKRMIAEAKRVLQCLETPVDSGVDVYGALCFGIHMNDLRRVFFKANCNAVFSKFNEANGKNKQLDVEPTMDTHTHSSTIELPLKGQICFSERHKWGVSDDPDKMESVMYAACRSPFTTPDTIDKLIKLGFGVDVPNRLPRGRSAADTNFGSTPLHGVVERLRQASSQQNKHAEVANCVSIIRLLQQAGANVDAINNMIIGGQVSKMTAKQEFDNFAVEGNPHKYDITTVGGLLTTRVEKSLKWNLTTQSLANFYDGTKCTFTYNQGHHANPKYTDDYVNMTITSPSGGHGVEPTGAQLVITHTLVGSATSKFASKLGSAKTIDAALSAAAPTVAPIKATAPVTSSTAAPTVADPKRVETSAVIDTKHLVYKAQLHEIIKRLNKKLGVTDDTTYGWTPYYKDSHDPTGDKPNNPIEKMATKAYSSFSDVMTVALKFFSAGIDVLEYGKTVTPNSDGTPNFKVWVAPMLLTQEFVKARTAEIKDMESKAKDAEEIISAHIYARNLRQSDGKKDSFYDPMENYFKEEFPLYSDNLIMLMAYLHGLYRIDRNNSEWGFNTEDRHNVRGNLEKRIDHELNIQNDIFFKSLIYNFGNGREQEFGFSNTLIGFILNTKYESEQHARDAISALLERMNLHTDDNFYPYQPYMTGKPNTNPWQILIYSPLKMLSKSTGVWKWQSDDGNKWTRFDQNQEPATLLEAAFKSGQPKVEYQAKGWTFDLQRMTQTSSVGDQSSRGIFRQITGTTSVAAVPAGSVATSLASSGLVATAAPSAASGLAAPSAATSPLSVDQFCTIAYKATADAEIIAAIESGRASQVGTGFVTGDRGTGNTALYCACRSPKTTAYSIRRMVEELGLDVNLQNSGNKSTPLHGLVERLKGASSSAASATSAAATTAFSSEYDNIHAIMLFLVTEKQANIALENTVHNGGTALKEFNLFKTAGGLSDDQQLTITALVTPPGVPGTAATAVSSSAAAPKVAAAAAAAAATARDALERLVTSAYLQALRDVIAPQFAQVKDMLTTNGNTTWGPYINAVMSSITDTAAGKIATFKQAFKDVIGIAKKLKATTVGDIDAEYAKIVQTVPTGSKASFTIVGPFIDGKYALKSNLARNSIVQVASQFDFLESMTPEYTEITLYPWDPTQGPGSSMASLEALILRDAAIKPTTPDGELQPLGQQPIFDRFKQQNWYKNGYLTPHRVNSEPDLLKAANSITDNIGTLKILAQESNPEFGKGPCIQVFSAAPSYQGEAFQLSPPVEGSAGAQICEILVLAQYMSIAKLAVIKSIADPSKRVNLHLTAVGQGAFNNPPYLYNKFITAVWEIVKPFNVSVYMHVYGDPGQGSGDNNPVFIDRVTALNNLFTMIDPSAKTASGSKLPKLSAEKFISWPD